VDHVETLQAQDPPTPSGKVEGGRAAHAADAGDDRVESVLGHDSEL